MKPAGEPLHPLTQLTVPISGRFLTISVEAVSIFVVEEENTIVTVQEKPGDCWVKVRENLKNPRSLVRDRDMHFLIYRLLDQTVDSLFPVVEGMLLLLHCYEMMLMTQGRKLTMEEVDKEKARREKIHKLNTQMKKHRAEGLSLLHVPQKFDIMAIHNLKGEFASMHRTLRPLRDVLNLQIEEREEDREAGLLKRDFDPGDKRTQKRSGDYQVTVRFLRDVHSHVVALIDDIENGVTECRDLSDLYNNESSRHQADVLYLLTFVTIIALPIQMMSGIYGMNFEGDIGIPELSWKYGYAYFWCTSLGMVFLLMAVFYYFGWI